MKLALVWIGVKNYKRQIEPINNVKVKPENVGWLSDHVVDVEVNQECSESKRGVFEILLDQNDLDDIPEEDVSNLSELPEDDFGSSKKIFILNLQKLRHL